MKSSLFKYASTTLLLFVLFLVSLNGYSQNVATDKVVMFNYYSVKSKGNKSSRILLGSSSTSIEFSTNMDMKIYNDQGQNIFAQSHDSFWQTENAYEITLQYLIKRSPLYRK